MSEQERAKAAAAKQLLRTIKVGDRVQATISAPANRQGRQAVVIDPNPFQPDGVRRIAVKYDGEHVVVQTLPTSIELVR